MVKSPEIKNIAEALAKFQKAVAPVKKGASNPFFKSKYADLASIIDVIREPLADNGLSFAQFPSGEGGLTSILMHTSGEFLQETYVMRPVDAKPQTAGSAITYMRRYALSAMLGIATEPDDDGNAASGKVNKKEAKKEYNPDKLPFGPGADENED